MNHKTTSRSQLEDEAAAKEDLLRQISRLNADILQWKQKWETEHQSKIDALEVSQFVF